MAYTSVIPVRRLDQAVKYVMNKEKTTAVSLQDAIDYAANRDKTEQARRDRAEQQKQEQECARDRRPNIDLTL